MKPRCEHSKSDLVPHALNELDGESRRAVDERIADCPSCRSESAALHRLLDEAGRLPRIKVSDRFKASLTTRIREEGLLAPDGAGDLGERLSLAVRIRLNAAFLTYRIRRSVAARVSLLAAALFLVALIGITLFSDGAVQKISPFTSDVAVPERSPDLGPYESMEEKEIVVWLPEEPEREGRGSDVDRLEPPNDRFPSPVVSGDIDEFLIPADEITEKVERENILAQGRYRMLARFNSRCKNQVMAGRGGDSRTDYAVHQGMRWLHGQQCDDGSWDPSRLGGDPRTRVGLTALAVAAFLSDGHTPRKGRFRETVSSGINFILASRDSRGQFGDEELDHGIALFNQSVAVLVLAENYIVAGGQNEDDLRSGIKRLESLIGALGPQNTHGTYSDTWAAMALRTSLMTGLDDGSIAVVAREVEERVALLARAESGREIDSDTPPPLYSAGSVAVSALFLHEGSTGAVTDPDAVSEPETVPFPDRRRPETLYALLNDAGLREPSFIFFISTALCEASDPGWGQWNKRVKTVLLREQDRDGCWRARGDWPLIDGGDIYTTALSILTLQVYYRFIKLEESCP